MIKFLKTIVVLILLFTPLVLGVFGLKKFFPQDAMELENKGKEILVQKIPFLKPFIKIEKSNEVKSEKIVVEKINLNENVKDYLTNEFIYPAICDDKVKYNAQDKFIGCGHCPTYLSKKNSDYFSAKFLIEGSFLKKEESEVILFMNGCDEEGNSAIVLRRGFGGWQKQQVFSGLTFEEKPLVFYDNDKTIILVGYKKSIVKDADQLKLFSVSLKGGKVTSNDILTIQSANGLTCSKNFIAALDSPILENDKKFLVQLDVLGWHENPLSECEIQTEPVKINLKSKIYTLHFSQKGQNFVGDKETQKVVTELERIQE